MRPLTGPHAFGLMSVPLRNTGASHSRDYSVQRLTADAWGPAPVPSSRKCKNAALLAAALIAVASVATVPVSYVVHRHLHH